MRWGPPLAPALVGLAEPKAVRGTTRDPFALFFDASNWKPTPSEPEPPIRRRMSDRDERVALTLMVVVLMMLLLMPLSVGMLVDIVRYLRK